MQVTRAGTARLQQFGVILGYKRVVIYVEPHADEHLRVTTNTARTTLMINNEPLPWADWAAEFREKMPSEIAELVNDSSADTSAEDFSKSIHERLKQILDLYKVSRYRSTPDGALAIDMDALVRGNQPRTAEYKPSGNGTLAGGKTDAAVRETVTKAVRQWFQMTLVETVIGIQALQKSQTWNDAEIARATSEEALTAAVMPRYHVYNSVKRELGSKFGKTRGAGVAD